MSTKSIDAGHIVRLACTLLVLGWPVQASAVPLCERLAEAIAVATELRELPLLRPLSCRPLSREAFDAARRGTALSAGAHVAPVLNRQSVLKVLRLVPSHHDKSCEPSADAIEAFYDPESESIVVPLWKVIPFSVLVHEVVHALQDQHFDLDALAQKQPATTDGELALLALIEGDAVVIQDRIPDDATAQVEGPGCSVSEAVEQLQAFPYTFGAFLVRRLIREGGSTLLNQAFRNPPQATAEVLHRERYSSPREVVRVSAGRQVRQGFHDSLGQYGIRVFLGQALSMQESVLGSKGWLGDSLELFAASEQGVIELRWKTEWLNEAEAVEFYRAALRVLHSWSGFLLNPAADYLEFYDSKAKVQIRRQDTTVSFTVLATGQ